MENNITANYLRSNFDLLIRYSKNQTAPIVSQQIARILSVDYKLMEAYKGLLLLQEREKEDVGQFLQESERRCLNKLKMLVKKQREEDFSFSIFTIPIYPKKLKRQLLGGYQIARSVFISICYQIMLLWGRFFGTKRRTDWEEIVNAYNNTIFLLFSKQYIAPINHSTLMFKAKRWRSSVYFPFFLLSILIITISFYKHYTSLDLPKAKNRALESYNRSVDIETRLDKNNMISYPEENFIALRDKVFSTDEPIIKEQSKKLKEAKLTKYKHFEITSLPAKAIPIIASIDLENFVSETDSTIVEEIKNFAAKLNRVRKGKTTGQWMKSNNSSGIKTLEFDDKGINLDTGPPEERTNKLIANKKADLSNLRTHEYTVYHFDKKNISIGILANDTHQNDILSNASEAFLFSLLEYYNQVNSLMVANYKMNISNEIKVNRYLETCIRNKNEFLITLELTIKEGKIEMIQDHTKKNVLISIYDTENSTLVNRKEFMLDNIYSEGIRFVNSLAYEK